MPCVVPLAKDSLHVSLALENSFGKGRATGKIVEMRLGDRAATLIGAPSFRVSGWNRGKEKKSLVRRVLVLGRGSFGGGETGVWVWSLWALVPPYHFVQVG